MEITLQNPSPILKMDSLEIANLVGSRHSDVRRTIERLANRGVIQLPPMAKVQNNQALSQNNKAATFIFEGETGKRDSIIVVAQLSPEFTAALVDRWQELEAAQNAQNSPFKIPANFAQALQLAANLEAEREKLTQEIAAKNCELENVKPKAAALDIIAADENTGLTMTQAAKILNIKRETLIDYLQTKKWIYRQNGSWVGYENHIKAGRLRYKEVQITDDKTEHISFRPYCHLTQKGIAELAESLANKQTVPI